MPSMPSLLKCDNNRSGCACALSSALLGPAKRVLPCPASEAGLTTLLQKHNVDTSRFGEGKAKPIASLHRELKEGSCTLEVDRKGKVSRCVEPVFVQLMYDDKVLVERAQVLPNGNRRERNSLLGEKREPNDNSALAAAYRGIREELCIVANEDTVGLIHHVEKSHSYLEQMDSASYPGIPAVYVTHRVALEILPDSEAASLFAPCGLRGCEPFETNEDQLEGGTQFYYWEWVDLNEAMFSKVKGLSDPRGGSIRTTTVSAAPSDCPKGVPSKNSSGTAGGA